MYRKRVNCFESIDLFIRIALRKNDGKKICWEHKREKEREERRNYGNDFLSNRNEYKLSLNSHLCYTLSLGNFLIRKTRFLFYLQFNLIENVPYEKCERQNE